MSAIGVIVVKLFCNRLESNCFATTRTDPRNLMHVAWESHAWFIFNLNTKIFYRQIIHCNYLHNKQHFFATCPLHLKLNNPAYLLGEPASLLVVTPIPSTLVSGLPTTAPPLDFAPLTLSHLTVQVTLFT